MTRYRRAGAPWRILAHSMEPGGGSGDSWNVASDNRFGGGDGQDTTVELDGRTYHQRHIELAGTDLDEVVVSKWLHLEQMDTGVYWINLAGVTITVRADRDGRPKHVYVVGPGDDDDPTPGCEYELTWNGA